jgi:hypothetical protein
MNAGERLTSKKLPIYRLKLQCYFDILIDSRAFGCFLIHVGRSLTGVSGLILKLSFRGKGAFRDA